MTLLVSTTIGLTAASDAPEEATAATEGPTDSILIGWVDQSCLTRECVTTILGLVHKHFTIIPFESVDDCVQYSGPKIDLIVYHSHEADTVNFDDIMALREAPFAAPLIVLSDATSMAPALAREILVQGSSGVLLTNKTTLRMVVLALGLAASGGNFVPKEFLLERPKRRTEPRESARGQLTQRELEVLALLKQGKTNKCIAATLSLSLNTAKVHVRNVMSKMGATNRTQAAMNADAPPGPPSSWNPMLVKTAPSEVS
jgi:DNA-binding NarL/FixJ family response regulator